MWPAWAQHPYRSPGDVVMGFSFYSQVWTCWAGPPSTEMVLTGWEKQSGKLYVKVSRQDLGSIAIWLLGADEESVWFTIVFRVCSELSWVLWHTCRGMKPSVLNKVMLCYQKASWRNNHREFKFGWKGSRCEPEGPTGSRVHQWAPRAARDAARDAAVMDAAAGML